MCFGMKVRDLCVTVAEYPLNVPSILGEGVPHLAWVADVTIPSFWYHIPVVE